MPFNPVNMFNFNKPRNQPSSYPFPTIYVVAASSLTSSLIIFVILCYFSYYLQMDNMAIPAQFIFLIVASLISILAVTFTTSTHIFRTMNPRTSMIINGLTFILWIIGLSIITIKIGSMVLGHSCSMPLWATSMGVMVCQLYKALYSFIVVGTAAAGASVILDISVSSKVSRRGMYREMRDGEKQDSPDLGKGVEFDADTRYDNDEDTTKLVGRTPDLSEQTPKLRPLVLQGRIMSNFWRREVESPAVKKYEAVRT